MSAVRLALYGALAAAILLSVAILDVMLTLKFL